jgi:cytoskeletal protein CcmA (bactofilin family)
MASNAHGKDSRENAFNVESKSDPASGTSFQREHPREEMTQQDSNAVSRSLSVLGPSVVFKGELSAEEDLLIQGCVEGSIHHNGANLTIGARGDVKADIVAQRIIVQGKVQGDMRASESVTVETSAQVHGNISAPRVALKEGAKFKGRVNMGVTVQDTTSKPKGSSETSSSTVRHGDGAEEIGEPKVDDLLT